MSVFRVRWEQRGGHVHCALFVAKHAEETFAKSGDFCVSAGEEFTDLQRVMPHVEFIERQKTGEAA